MSRLPMGTLLVVIDLISEYCDLWVPNERSSCFTSCSLYLPYINMCTFCCKIIVIFWLDSEYFSRKTNNEFVCSVSSKRFFLPFGQETKFFLLVSVNTFSLFVQNLPLIYIFFIFMFYMLV